ncbi:hypothetical protein DLAC_00988 [Tieghemostelium lacteum]|uniref:HTTM-like domain-containing protein n=1 Tax=Tieghemostelium lacteum TaxID=361077 RepID=A0A152A7J5_TIELA|nr:hypothetical protein DLAC_00988 [Tieghemostelium lacteum]|eukprot:KYR02174.1 hypothetical protein DLAC_00988 [Tieghemostelium lacteum]
MKKVKKQYEGFKNHYIDSIKLKLQQMFGMDLRSIAFFRIVMALCVIGDVLERMIDLRVMYTEDGFMPRNLVVTMLSKYDLYPIHLLHSSWYMQFAFFWLHIGFALMMLIGYRTRTFSFLTWYMTISLQTYNIIINHSGDVFFRMMLFINIFLPSGDLYSIDSSTFSNENQKPPLQPKHSISHHHPCQLTPNYSNRRYRYLSFATLAILVQMGSMYVASYFYKTGAEWKNGEAAYYAISMEFFATDLARFLLNYRELLRWSTLAVLKWELYGIFFMSIPFFTDYFRLFAAFGFFMLHVGFVSCLKLGLFFYVTAGAQVINIPPFVWDNIFNWLDKRILKGQRPLKVYYNTTSPLSQYTTLVLKTFFILPNTVEFSPMETMVPDDCISLKPIITPSIETDEDQEFVDNNGKLVNNGNSLLNSKSNTKLKYFYDDWLITIDEKGIKKTNLQGLMLVWSKSPLLFPLAWIYGIALSNFTNGFVSKILQYVHVKSQQSQIGENVISLYQKKKNLAKKPSRYICLTNNLIMAFMCWFILAYNLDGFDINIGIKPVHFQMARLLSFDQNWKMFSPSPPKNTWWNVIHGKLQDGTEVELFKNEGLFNFEINTDVNFDKPVPFKASFGNHRWFKFWENGFYRHDGKANVVRLDFGRFICREFNSRHFGNQRLEEFKIYYVYYNLNVDGTHTSTEILPQSEHIC